MKVRTTLHPHTELEVTEREAESLRRQGLLVAEPYAGEIPAARVARENQEEKKS